VELTDNRIIEAFLAELSGSKRPKPPGAPLPEAVRGARPRPCQCGICPHCADNLKWETIFDQKFADHDYYKPRPVAHWSALN
jgi:hypothetical protein